MSTSISVLGCGWLGLPLAHELLSQGYHVKGTTTSQEKLKELKSAGIEPYRMRLDPELECDDCNAFWQSPILVINIPPGKKKEESHRVNHSKQIESVLHEVNKPTSEVEWIIYISSTSVYGNATGLVTEEDAVLSDELTERGRRVLETEQLLSNNESVDYSIVRFGGLYGYDRHPVNYLKGRKSLKNGKVPVNLIHRDDCINIIISILDKNARNKIFNGVSDGHPPRKTFYRSAARHFGLNPPEFADDNGDDENEGKIVSNQKLKEELGYQFLYPNPMDHTP